MNFIDGEVLYIDKPYRWTSFDVVKRVRGTLLRRMRMKRLKVGHAGTLDPLATGVMAICTGKATKLIDTLQAHTKEYVATIALGATTPSFDLETEIDALMNPQPDTSLPTCEIEIVHLDMPYKDAASQERAELETRWEIQEHTETNRITFSMYSGSEWNSPLEVRDYISDEQSGCFRIIRRFFMEAAEGHGVRFAAMVDTFAVIQPPQNGE